MNILQYLKNIEHSKIVITLLSITLILTLFGIYQDWQTRKHACFALSVLHDSIATKIDGSTYDKDTIDIFNTCSRNYSLGL